MKKGRQFCYGNMCIYYWFDYQTKCNARANSLFRNKISLLIDEFVETLLRNFPNASYPKGFYSSIGKKFVGKIFPD